MLNAKSLGGQWTGRYSGSNSGQFVLELDEVGNHYEGTATAWDDRSDFANALVHINTVSNGVDHVLPNLSVTLLDNLGNLLSPEAIKASVADGISHPTHVDIHLTVVDGSLEASWKTSIGTQAKGFARLPKTWGSERSSLENVRTCNWEEFKAEVNTPSTNTFIYRGHERSEWRLRSSFHRTGRASLRRYGDKDVNELLRTFSSLSQRTFNLRDPKHFLAFLNLAQHHGYPTPLIDWTFSPYVAAFFAFRKVPKSPRFDSKSVRIFKLSQSSWNTLTKVDKLFPNPPNLTILDALAYDNPRVIPQQALSLLSNVDDVESHIIQTQSNSGAVYLEAFDLPRSQRNLVMRELSLMGVTASSLFPGYDGACEALKEHNFP